MAEGAFRLRWAGRHALVTLPEHVDVSNAGQLGEQLLLAIGRGAGEVTVDMSATVSCDYAGAGAVARAYQRAAGNGTQLRLVVTAPVVHRVLSLNGLCRLIPVYPSLAAATAAGAHAAAAQQDGAGPTRCRAGGIWRGRP